MSSEEHLEKAGADLRAAASSMSVPQMRVRTPVRGGLIAFATGLLVVLVVGIPLLLTRTAGLGGSPTGGPVATTTVPETSSTSPGLRSCGTELPFHVTLPDDFTGPNVGPSPHAPSPAEEGQLIIHWLGRDGSVEIRWPANEEYLRDAEWGEPEEIQPEPDWPMFIGPSFPDVDGVDRPIVSSVLPTSAMTGPCDASQLAIYSPSGDGEDASLVGATFGTGGEEGLVIYPGLLRPQDKVLVVETIETDTLPEVRACDGGPEAQSVPKKFGTTSDSPVFDTPEEALQDMLDTSIARNWSNVGYFKLVSPDGTITFGHPYDDNSPDPRPDNGLVIAVTVVEVEGGWSVTQWETSGC